MYRSLTLPNGQKWSYVVGSRMSIIRDPKVKRHSVATHELAGMTPDNWDDYIRNNGPGIGPGHIRKYIEDNLC